MKWLTVIKTGQITHQQTLKKILGGFPVISTKLLDRRFTPVEVNTEIHFWTIDDQLSSIKESGQKLFILY